MSNKNESKLTTKISPLIEGQVPDFIQADHPIFVTFLKHYYEFLESGELQITVNIDNVLQETNSPAYILEESAGEKVVLETGSGTTGKFENNETITGSTSKATAKVLVEDSSNGRLFISAQQKFITGETITGQTSGSTGIVTKYRGNPVQNIQQLMEYANPDNTIYDFLDSFRNQFLKVIPSTLATGVSKRNLIKSIKDLYTAKGTADGHKYFLRLLLDDEATIKYPEEDMLRISDGRWTTKKIMRVLPVGSFDMSEVVGQQIKSKQSSASAIVVSASSKLEGTASFTELELDPKSIIGSFVENENITSISKTTDSIILMTVKNIIADNTISNAGALYTTTDSITTSSLIGNGGVKPKIDIVGRGSVDEIIIDDAGTGYEEGDVLTFTATGQSNTSTATAKVSVVSGMLILEDGGQILAEDGNITQTETIQLVSEDDFITSSGTSPNIVTEAGDPITLESFHNIIIYPENPLLPSTIGLTLEPDSSDKGIRKINLTNGGGGYSALPIITIAGNTTANLLSSSNTIGSIEDVKLQTFGFDYSTAPESVLNINVILKDITGTFTIGSPVYLNILPPLTVRGTISSWDTERQLLTIAPSSTSPFKIDQEVGSNTAYSSVAGENIILEDGGIFSLEDGDQFVVTDTNKIILETGVDRIVDEEDGYPIIAEASLQEGIVYQSGSIYGTIASVKVGKVDLSVGTLTTTDGLYLTGKNRLGESEIRLQDSYYYQQFSYEIQVGASAAEYLDSLKKAVHPSGFLPFGKVSIATKVVAAMKILTAADIPSYTADTDTFTPELASMFKIVFDTLFGRRLGTVDDGTTLNTLPAEGVNDDFLTDTNLGTTSGKRDLTLTHEVLVTMSQQPYNTSNPNALKYLNLFPFMHSAVNIELETQTGSAGTLVAFDITERLTTNFATLHGTLHEDLDTTETVITIDDSLGGTPDITDSDIRKFVVGQVIQIDDESMRIVSLDAAYLAGTSGNGLFATVLRGYVGTRNLLKHSEDIGTVWVQVGSSASTLNDTASPTGTITADKLTQASTVYDGISQTLTLSTSTVYTQSVYIKPDDTTLTRTGLYDPTATAWIGYLDVTWTSGVPSTSTASNVTNVIYTLDNNGWYRVSFNLTTHSSNTAYYFQQHVDRSGGGLSAWFWGWQLELGSSVSEYIPTTSAASPVGSTATHTNNSIVKLNNYTWDRTDGDPTSSSSNYPTFDSGDVVGGVLLLTAADAAGSFNIILEDGGIDGAGTDAGDRIVTEENSDPIVVEDELQVLVQMSPGDKVVVEDGANENALTSPTLSSLGDVSTGIKFTDIFQYHVLRLEGDVYDDNLLLEDGDDIMLEDDVQTTRLQWPDSIWSHPNEKAFTIPAEINISAA